MAPAWFVMTFGTAAALCSVQEYGGANTLSVPGIIMRMVPSLLAVLVHL